MLGLHFGEVFSNKLKKTFESMGLEFLGSPEVGAGVRWKAKK